MAHVADYIVIAVFLAICMVIGIYHGFRGKKRQTPEYYLLGNRHLQLFPVAISFFVTYQSAISLMGVPAEIYNYGLMIAWVYLGVCTSLLLSTFTIVPLIHPLRITSAFEYLELRFHSRAVRLLGTGFSMLQTKLRILIKRNLRSWTLYMGITLYAPALALEAVANIPLWASVVIAGGVSIVYTAIVRHLVKPFKLIGFVLSKLVLSKLYILKKYKSKLGKQTSTLKQIQNGGIKSVVWTDAFQCLIVVCGTIAVLIKGFLEIGHPETFTRIIKEENRLQFYDSFLMSIPITIIYGSFLCVLGLVLFSYYNIIQCDPIITGQISNANQLMPYFVFDVMKSYPGIPGIYISALFSGSLSTVSSGINSLAANTVEDLIKNHLMKYNKFQVTLVAKLAGNPTPHNT
ncbi:hypothetical protein KUTeg_002893 [Tegillarca granosa]|uniref:Sodium-coupled monocarboxylate transporter 1 n=1 Tax=Tegillarca granosa TaxID=220873 RepID=A0ABQ9FUY3_TEGGR|nr:hypothetical protein KUTeg_002893 [Tegillarca granosa]